MGADQRGNSVSILTRAFARVQPGRRASHARRLPRFNPHSSFRPSATKERLGVVIPQTPVSILTRAFARVQLSLPAWSAYPLLFQSSLELSPECNPQRGRGPCGPRFNPHSSFRPSATRPAGGWRLRHLWFQSSLELSPECNRQQPRRTPTRPARFNPHSSFRPSATSSA